MAESTPADPSKLRVSDAEREAVVSLLQTAASEGRLTLGEFSERTESVYVALTRGELDRITDDLPTPATPEDSQIATVGHSRAAAPTASRFQGRRISAIMGDHDERLVGEVPAVLRVRAIMGDVTLDLRDAALPGGRVEIIGQAIMGSIRVVVPDGIEVRSGGTNIMGEVKTRVNPGHRGNGPFVRVDVLNVMGEVRVVDDAHHKKRSKWSHWWGSDD
ncbi:cell wall-active antibiotic response 4TMS protein YvqF [Stackebrandtia endophytica]|uniref:Cell wall-active antibiotic response 4TMS protein YvqF n=1 Tax=Stackebrandtia endophytica TaxID=1496996 RepID=A0A543AUM8_9ACTN|nr:DUF1707 domain-containing protein [Stackebrandtia endophytica]TQL76269.1 cell wall-active antibiotic response 4TMS protein YvqF [Stackebrandtia endophytica]